MKKTIEISPDTDSLMTDYTCPHCAKGLLRVIKKRLVVEEYKSSIKKHSHPDMDADWVESSCSGVLECNHDDCKEFVSFCGDAQGDQHQIPDETGYYCVGIEYIDRINIKYIYPSPHLIPLNNKYPNSVNLLLKDSFSLYWSSTSSCANKLRIVIEEILNDMKIPKKHKIKKGKNKGKFADSITHLRINRLGKRKGLNEASKYLLAVKEIGNSASHATSFNEKSIIPAYNLLDKSLDLLYVGYHKDLKHLRDLATKKKLA